MYERRQLKAVPTPTPSRCKPSQLLSYNLVFNGQSDNSVVYAVRVETQFENAKQVNETSRKNRLISSVLVLGFKLPANPRRTGSLSSDD